MEDLTSREGTKGRAEARVGGRLSIHGRGKDERIWDVMVYKQVKKT